MSCVHFKFKNRQDYEKVAISGLEVSGKELKEAIMKKKKIDHSNLEIRDAQTKRVYSDTDMIKRNASVVVMRSVIPNAAKLPKTQHKDPTLLPSAGSDIETFASSANDPQKTSDLTAIVGTEEDKLKAMIEQAGQGYTAEDYAKYPVRSGIHPGLYRGPPPKGYVCNRCRKPGHWIQLCPTNGDPAYDKRNQQKQVLPKISVVGAAKTKHTAPAPKEREMPEELKCPMCKQAMRDAVTIPCCTRSFCDECIREHLLEKDFTCPLCGEEDVSPDALQPNKELRESVKQFRSQVAEERGISVASLSSKAGFTPHQLSASHIPKPPLTAAAALLERITARATNLSSSSSSLAVSSSASSSSTAASSVTTAATNSHPATSDVKSSQVSVAGANGVSSSAAAAADAAKREPEKGESDSITAPSDQTKTKEEEKEKSSVAVEKVDSDSASLAVPKTGRGEGSAQQQSRSKSPSPSAALEVKKPTQPIMASRRPHPHRRSKPPLSAIPHPTLPLIPGLTPPSLLPLPVLPGQVPVGVPTGGNLLNSVPGLGVIQTLPHTATLAPVAKDYRAEAEFLLSQKRTRAASPPLTAEEFYRQQKILNQVIRHKSPAHSTGQGSAYSYTSDSNSAASDSYSTSESGSESDDGSALSHSPSLSPLPKKRRRQHHHKKKHTKDMSREREGERGSERKHKKRRREISEDSLEHNRHRRKHRRHRSRHQHGRLAEPGLDPHLLSSDTATSDATHHHHHRHHKKKKRHHRHSRHHHSQDQQLESAVARATEDTQSGLVGRGTEALGDSSVRENVGGDLVGVAKIPVLGSVEEVCGVTENNVGDRAHGDDPVCEPTAQADVVKGSSIGKEEESGNKLGDNAGGSGPREKGVVARRRFSSGDQLLKDIDQLLAEENDDKQSNLDSSQAPDSPKLASKEREKELASNLETEVVPVLSLQTDDTFEDDRVPDMDNTDDGSSSNGLEEGEVLSEAEQGSDSGAGDAEQGSDGGPGTAAVVNSDHHYKPRLRSVASTVQAVSSETPDLSPSDTQPSPEDDEMASDSLLPSPTPQSPPPVLMEDVRIVERKYHHHHRHQHERENDRSMKMKKKRRRREKTEKTAEVAVSGHRRHKQKKRERDGESKRHRHQQKRHRQLA